MIWASPSHITLTIWVGSGLEGIKLYPLLVRVRVTASSETRGQIAGGKGNSKRAGKYGTQKSKERREEPLATMSYQTSPKRSPPFWLLIGARKRCVFVPNQKPERRRPFGTGLVRHCSQGLFSPFFTFLRATFFRLDFPLPPLSAPGSPRMGLQGMPISL